MVEPNKANIYSSLIFFICINERSTSRWQSDTPWLERFFQLSEDEKQNETIDIEKGFMESFKLIVEPLEPHEGVGADRTGFHKNHSNFH